MLQAFIQKNQVLLSAIAGALTLTIQQFMGAATVDYKVFGLATLMAVAGVLGNQWRGKGVTVMGILGIAGYAFVQIQQTGKFTWPTFIGSVVVGMLSMIAPPPKNISYEQSQTIVQAKEQGAAIQASQAPPPKPTAQPTPAPKP